MKKTKITGGFITLQHGEFYRIKNTQEMEPFFINIAASSDVWVFLSSNGALTAGRSNADGAIFPYETEDRLHAAAHTGPKTIVRLEDGRVWEPFNTGYDNPYEVRRSIFKRTTGDAVIFEERNKTLNLTFSQMWETSEEYGIVRTAWIENRSDKKAKLNVLDGVENIIPYGITSVHMDSLSCLSDAYKVSQRVDCCDMAIYSLTSAIVDKPEPVEVLRSNVVWSIGKAENILLSSKQVRAFAKGKQIQDEHECNGRKGVFLASRTVSLAPRESKDWMLVMDAKLSQKKMSELINLHNITSSDILRKKVEDSIRRGTQELERIVAAADGLQETSDKCADVRHYMNVLYNNKRGGVFLDNYNYDPKMFETFIKTRNKELASRKAEFIKNLSSGNPIDSLHDGSRFGSLCDGSPIDSLCDDCQWKITDLLDRAYADGDADIIRLTYEFLPLTFSRRHGDPSRPWNRFNIHVKDEAGNRVYAYEGNWRDIFQNWEALALSFPGYLMSMVAKFLNASTADGFNPYRINQDGIDWEIPEPNNPWSGYGYWGDHQIVYLTRLLELLKEYMPDQMDRLLKNEIYSFANVPYEIRTYAEILQSSKDTIHFNHESHELLQKNNESMGSDAKLLSIDGKVYHAAFIEKLLIPILAKLSNLIPRGGIWMNTNRPEWNDANNAIVGNGISMVTVYQLYRHLCFCKDLTRNNDMNTNISIETIDWLNEVFKALSEYKEIISNCSSNGAKQRAYLDAAGMAFEKYRAKVYRYGFFEKQNIDKAHLLSFFDTAIDVLADTIDANKRDDGMYNSYNILTLSEDSLTVSELFLMLEGQTAVLGSTRLGCEDALSLVRKMNESDLMSDLQHTYFLYPRKTLKMFMEKNIISEEDVASSALIQQLLADGNERLVVKDTFGNVRFSDNIRQSSDLDAVLAELAHDNLTGGRFSCQVSNTERTVLHKNLTKPRVQCKNVSKPRSEALEPSPCQVYERVFKHHEFTGRSGIMYKYEGIGCIYWHQNAKFLLSFGEVISREIAARGEDCLKDIQPLLDEYYKLRAGFGFNKEPSVWGAFPLEPYSHTPYNMPAQQPGMTGQVKEDILSRTAEMGISVRDGRLHFQTAYLKRNDFCKEQRSFKYIDVSGETRTLTLKPRSIALTICQVPVVYTLSDKNEVNVHMSDDSTITQPCNDGLYLTKEQTTSILWRDNKVERIEVGYKL